MRVCEFTLNDSGSEVPFEASASGDYPATKVSSGAISRIVRVQNAGSEPMYVRARLAMRSVSPDGKTADAGNVVRLNLNDSADAPWVDGGDGMRLRRLHVPFDSAQSIRNFAVRLCSQLGRRLDDACPIADASTVDGVRVHAVIAPLVPQGAAISIRLPDATAPRLESLAHHGMFPMAWLPLLRGLVRLKATMLVTGGTGAGKTTMLKALLMQCPPTERIITVEEVRELGMFHHANHVSLVTREANVEGVGAIDLSQLIAATLRMRPDRVVVGECRGAEIADLLRALNSGHRGGMTTLHANSVEAVPSRLVALGLLAGLDPRATAALAENAFDVVLHVERTQGYRRISQIGQLTVRDGRLQGSPLAFWNGGQVRTNERWMDFMRRWGV